MTQAIDPVDISSASGHLGIEFRRELVGRLGQEKRGIETVYQDLAVAPALDIAPTSFWVEKSAATGCLVPGFGCWIKAE